MAACPFLCICPDTVNPRSVLGRKKNVEQLQERGTETASTISEEESPTSHKVYLHLTVHVEAQSYAPPQTKPANEKAEVLTTLDVDVKPLLDKGP